MTPVRGSVRMTVGLDLVGAMELEWLLRLLVIVPAVWIGSAIGQAIARAIA